MKPVLAAGALVAAVWCGAAAAHHSAAMFDATQCASVTGTVRNLQWQYPHSWLWIVVPGGSGEGDIWGFEMPAPSALVRAPNWSRQVLPKGEKVTVSFAPLKDGRHAGLANAIKLSGGLILHAAPNAFACEAQLWKPTSP
jgi:hypothetical protein